MYNSSVPTHPHNTHPKQTPTNTHTQLQAKAVEEAAQAGTTDAHAALLQMTLAFNNARVLEACGEWETAERLYEQASDSYSDCYLRLALLAKRRGEYERALEWVGKAEKIVDLQADAMCIKGVLGWWGGCIEVGVLGLCLTCNMFVLWCMLLCLLLVCMLSTKTPRCGWV